MLRARPTPCTITPQQEKAWEMTRAALLWNCPAFSHILYTMMDKVGSKYVALFTKDVPIAATDGVALLINPDTFFNYSLNKRVFIVAHEIMHCIFNHCGLMYHWSTRGKITYNDGHMLPYDQQTMNIAMDLVINDALVQAKVGEFDSGWLHNTQLATEKDSAIDAYRKIYKKGQSPGAGGQGFDEHLAPGTVQGKDPHSASSERDEGEWRMQVAAGANAARAQGKLPAGIERLLNEILNPQVDWKDKIQALFARRLGSGTFDWQRPDRRLIARDIYAPGRSGFGADTVVVAVDTSGSIGGEELDMFMAEMAGILDDVRPKRLMVVWCDAQVHRVDECEDSGDLNTLRCKGAPGGGGTSFVPVFELLAEQGIEPEALVYMTDGMGTFPAAVPSYPVIWGNIYPESKYPFGDVVDIPRQIKRAA